MKKVVLNPGRFRFTHFGRSLAVAAGLMLIQSAQAALVRDEQFNYPDGGLNGQGGWTVSGGTAPATVEAGNLNVSGLATSTGSQVQMDGAGGTATIANTADTLNTTVSGNAVYASFMVHVTDPTTFTTTYESFAELGIGANYYCAVYVKDAGSGNMQFGVRRATGGNPAGQTGTVPNSAASVFIVVKYEVSTSGNDSAKMWVNPSSATFGGGSDPASPAISTSGGSDAANGSAFGGFRWTAGIGAEIDSLRIGRSYADVTPTSAGCEAPSVTSGATPSSTNVNVGASATFTVVAQPNNRTYQWQVMTNGGSTWENASTGSGATSATYTTPVLAALDSGNQYQCVVSVPCTNVTATSAVATVTVSCNAANVTDDPDNTTAFIGQTATFFVTAAGTSPSYQWEESANNGGSWSPVGGNSPSYTTPTLNGSENGHQYRCTVNVACDSSTDTSTVATLTVTDPTTLSFRSAQSGPWNVGSTWETSTNGVNWISGSSAVPYDGNSNITIRATHTVSVTNDATADDLVIESGGVLEASGGALTIVNGAAAVDCDVAGSLRVANVANSTIINNGDMTIENGGLYVWARAGVAASIPTATWADGSTCEVQDCNTAIPTGLAQSFYDFHWNKTSAGQVNLGAQLTTVRRNLKLTGNIAADNTVRFLMAAGTCDLTVGGDFILESGYTTLSGGSGAGTILNIYVNGNMAISNSATLDSRNSGGGSAANIFFTNTATPHSLSLLNPSGSVSHSGTGGGCPINWRVGAGVTLTLVGGNLPVLNANNATTDSVTVEGTLDCDGNQIAGSSSGTLTVSPGGTIVGQGTAAIGSGLSTLNFDGTLNLPGLPTFSGGENFQVFGAGTYNITSMAIIPATPPGATSWDYATTPGTLIVVGGGGGGNLPLVITNRIRIGTTLILQGGVGTNDGPFTVLTATNVSASLANWSTWAMGNFDGSGNFSVTNTVNTTTNRSFYIIHQP